MIILTQDPLKRLLKSGLARTREKTSFLKPIFLTFLALTDSTVNYTIVVTVNNTVNYTVHSTVNGTTNNTVNDTVNDIVNDTVKVQCQ